MARFFFIFHALSFELNIFFDRRFPLKSDDSNFVQNYFGVRPIFCNKKNWDQIDNDVTMMSSLL